MDGGREEWRERGREGGRIWCEDTLKEKRSTECGYLMDAMANTHSAYVHNTNTHSHTAYHFQAWPWVTSFPFSSSV